MNSPLPTPRDGLLGSDVGVATSLDDLRHHATDLALEGARTVREQALRARDSAAGFVQHQPVAALLLAAAGGAAVMLLAGWLMRSPRSRH